MKKINKLKLKLKNLKKDLTFQKVTIGLLVILFALIFLNLFLGGSFNIGGLDFSFGDSRDEFSFDEEGDSGLPNGVKSVDYVDKESKLTSIEQYMPFYSDAFNVVYDHFLNEFKVYINPSSSITNEDVFDWFESFEDIENYSEVTIVFETQTESGAPAGINEIIP